MRLTCVLCGWVADSIDATHCAICGEGLEVEYIDLDASKRTASWPPRLDRPLYERYQAWLPDLEQPVVTLGEGSVPVLRSSVLSDSHAGDVYLALEGVNPTGSFKDRGTSIGMSMVRALGFVRAAVVSSGNMACSVAAYASQAGMPAVVIVSSAVPAAKLRATAVYDADVVRVECDHGTLFFEVAALDFPETAFLNSDHPFRLEGQKTSIFDLFARLDGDLPDMVVVPVSSGGNMLAILKGLSELLSAGVLVEMPRLIGVQPAGCAPIHAAHLKGAAQVSTLLTFESIAGSISNPRPPAGNRVLAAARVGRIELVCVTDEEMLVAQRDLAATGIWVQPDSASVIAAVRQLAESGDLRPSDTVACILTGAGHRDLAHPSESFVATKTRTVDRSELRQALQAAFGMAHA